MDCKCFCWQDKTLKLSCARCGGMVDYIKCIQVKQEDSKKRILDKLKRDLEGKKADIYILKNEIRELENEINDEENEKCDNSDCSECLKMD